VRFTEMLDYSSAVALLGYSLILAVIRTGGMRAEAARVMVSAPITAFISTHILYLNLYKFDYGMLCSTCDVVHCRLSLSFTSKFAYFPFCYLSVDMEYMTKWN
jgi:hypothetical protein